MQLSAKDFDGESLSYFPLLVEDKLSKQQITVMSPEEIPAGREITVLEINYKEQHVSSKQTTQQKSTIEQV